jgi:hypothetical protein
MQCVVSVFDETSGEVEALRNGAVDMIDAGSQSAWTSFNGLEGAPKAPFLRLLQQGTDMAVAQIIRNDSDMRKPGDLRGKRVTQDPSPSMLTWTGADLANRGLKWEDVIPVPTSGRAEAQTALTEGRADAAHFSLGSGQVSEMNATIKGGVRFLGMDNSAEAIARMREFFPGFYLRLFKAGSLVAVTEDMYAMCASNYLCVGASVPDEAVYLIAKALNDYYAEMAPFHPTLIEWTPDKFVAGDSATVPYHPGAIKLYKEVGLWTDAAQQQQDKLMAQAE